MKTKRLLSKVGHDLKTKTLQLTGGFPCWPSDYYDVPAVLALPADLSQDLTLLHESILPYSIYVFAFFLCFAFLYFRNILFKLIRVDFTLHVHGVFDCITIFLTLS